MTLQKIDATLIIMQKFSTSEAIKLGWITVKSNLKLYCSATLFVIFVPYIPTLLLNIIGILTGSTKMNPSNIEATLSIILLPVIIAVNMIIAAGTIRFTLKATNNKDPKIKDLYTTNKKELISFTIGSIIFGAITILGFIALIIPGIYLTLKYQLFSYIMIDKNLSPIESLKKSAEITKGNKLNLFMFALALGGINILGFLAFIVGLLITIPISWIAMGHVYRSLTANTQTTESQPQIS